MTQEFTLKNCAYLLAVVCIAGCTLTPELPAGGRVGASDPDELDWPELLPSNSLPAVQENQAPLIAEHDAENQIILQRAEALRAKTARLNGAVLTQQERNALAKSSQ